MAAPAPVLADLSESCWVDERMDFGMCPPGAPLERDWFECPSQMLKETHPAVLALQNYTPFVQVMFIMLVDHVTKRFAHPFLPHRAIPDSQPRLVHVGNIGSVEVVLGEMEQVERVRALGDCTCPLQRARRPRRFEEFGRDTQKHGWILWVGICSPGAGR